MKIHRPEHLPNTELFLPILKKNNIHTLILEPEAKQDPKALSDWCRRISTAVRVYQGTPYLPTKTIRVDLTTDEENIFRRFSEAKRRAVRRASRLGVIIEESNSIRELISIKNKSSGLFGFITTTGIDKLWEVFAPTHATILLAYRSGKIVGGVLLIFWDYIAYYWIAGATHEGKKLFAPTLLAWEAIKAAKKRGNTVFDFVGVWDERTPHMNRDWLGFTKFKDGFGGKYVYYPIVNRP